MIRIIRFIKNDVVLFAAWILALISALFVHPSAQYFSYIDFRSLGILWSLMVIMQLFKENGLFELIGQKLLHITHKLWQLVTVLVLLCFFFSMLITNDVALITFVPFTIMLLCRCERKDMLIPVIVLQTVAANLGSMMTPIGNPQNLYLFGLSGLSFGDFVALVLPYTLISLILICASILFIQGKKAILPVLDDDNSHLSHPFIVALYGALFVEAILAVTRFIPYGVLVLTVLAASLLFCRRIIIHVDYGLLLTFVGFFIFTGNIGSIPVVSLFLKNIIERRELLTGVLASQFISNVPAALLLSGFSENLRELILGVNFGGLGTLIASMASLISYKLYAAESPENKGKYLLSFTAVNIIFLAVLLLFHAVV